MLTLKLISEETERVIKGLEKKHFDNAKETIEKVLEYDRMRREYQQKLDNNKQQQNLLSKQYLSSNYLFINTLQNLLFCVPKAALLHGKSVGFAAQKSRFRNVKAQLSLFNGVYFTKTR